MNDVLRMLVIWLIATSVTTLVLFFIILPMIPLIVRNLIIMHWTRPSEVSGDHPLLEVTNKQVRYLGGEQYPLPRKFALFGCAWWIGFFPPFSLFMATASYVPSLWVRLAMMLAFQAVLLIGLMGWFRRLQPRWLREHLATLPSDARPAPTAPHQTPA